MVYAVRRWDDGALPTILQALQHSWDLSIEPYTPSSINQEKMGYRISLLKSPETWKVKNTKTAELNLTLCPLLLPLSLVKTAAFVLSQSDSRPTLGLISK